MKIITLGKPGSGKFTISSALAKKLQLEHLDVGQILREETSKGTKDGLLIREEQAKGELAPSDIVQRIVLNKLKSCNDFILDGAPRKMEEAKYYIENGVEFDFLFNLEISDETARKRLEGRGRFDDKKEVLDNRLRVHKTQVRESIDFFRKLGIVLDIDGERKPEEIIDEIINHIGK